VKPMTAERARLAEDLTLLTDGHLDDVAFEHLLQYVADKISPPTLLARFWRLLQRR
jgi:hypothetical protein